MIAILYNEVRLSSASLVAISDVFECAFIWWTDPDERTAFVYRDTYGFVGAWHQLARFRFTVGADMRFDGTCVAPQVRQSVFQAYLRHFATKGLEPGQKRKFLKS